MPKPTVKQKSPSPRKKGAAKKLKSPTTAMTKLMRGFTGGVATQIFRTMDAWPKFKRSGTAGAALVLDSVKARSKKRKKK